MGAAARVGSLGSNIDDEELGRAYDPRVVRRLLGYVRPYKAMALVSAVAIVIYTLTGVAIPWIIKDVVDSAATLKTAAGLQRAGLFFAVVALVSFLSHRTHLIALAKVSQRMVLDVRKHLFTHLQRLSLTFYDKNEVGRIMSRAQNDVHQLEEFLNVIIAPLGDLLTLGGIVVAMLLLDWRLALLSFTVLPVMVGIMLVWRRFAWKTFIAVRKAIAVVNASLQENVSGVRVVQSMNREASNLQRFDRLNYRHLDANLQASRLSAALTPLVEVLMAISLGLVIIYGGSRVLGNTLEVGIVVAFALYIQRFFEPIRHLTMQYNMLQRSMTSGLRIFELLDWPVDVKDKPDAKELPPIKGEVTYENVSFAYTPGLEVLKEINLHVKPGQTVALVGSTGAGKSTFVSLLLRFYDVTKGRILVDGYDIRDVKRSSLARQMSFVPQEPFLFSGTIRDNIRYCHEEASDERIIEVAKAVGAHDFIMRLEKGYDSMVEERGGNLSPGQRQLIAIARALVGDPKIIIMDEATASVDSYTEMLLQKALRTLLKGRTAFVIAHRLSTIRNADRIVVLDHGRIVETGNHQELLAKGGIYANLYHKHFSDGERPVESLSTTTPIPAFPDGGDKEGRLI